MGKGPLEVSEGVLVGVAMQSEAAPPRAGEEAGIRKNPSL